MRLPGHQECPVLLGRHRRDALARRRAPLPPGPAHRLGGPMSATTGAPTYQFPGGVTVPLPVRYTLGLDLGKLSDPSALAIAEERPESVREHFGRATITPVWGDDPDYRIPWLQRWPL